MSDGKRKETSRRDGVRREKGEGEIEDWEKGYRKEGGGRGNNGRRGGRGETGEAELVNLGGYKYYLLNQLV